MHSKKSFHNVVVFLYIPNKITETFSAEVNFLYTIRGVHDESMSLPNGS